MSLKWALALFVFLSSYGFCEDAEINGERYLGIAGNTVRIKLHSQFCDLRSISDIGIKNFKIVLECDGVSQVLWDINDPGENDLSFDDPKFSLRWAGDLDNDYKIDLKMDMSPKYSCSRETVYLSTLAEDGELVGIKGEPENNCC